MSLVSQGCKVARPLKGVQGRQKGCSVADQQRFDADSDPTFQADPDPAQDPIAFTRGRKIFFNYCFQSLPKLVMCNFLSKNAGGRVGDEKGEG